MKIKIGINGFGRIGRLVFRVASAAPDVEVVGINDLLTPDYLAYLLKYDSTHGPFGSEVEVQGNQLRVEGQTIRLTAQADATQLAWSDLGADVVVESTGLLLTQAGAEKHLQAGAKKVIITAPPKDAVPLFVMGVNQEKYQGESIVSNASCTTNCLAPMAKLLHETFGLVEGLMSTIHATTATQRTVDGPSQKDWRAGRGAGQNIIPATTGAAQAVARVIPALEGKLTGMSFRVPVPDVSVVDLTCRLQRAASYRTVCEAFKKSSQQPQWQGILGYTEEAVVSSDFIGDPRTCIFDASAGLALNDQFMKLVAWYDNECGYSHKVVDLARHIATYVA